MTAGSLITRRLRRCGSGRWTRWGKAPIRKTWRLRWAAPQDGLCLAGEIPRGWQGRAEGAAGTGPAAEAGRAAVVPAVCADCRAGSAADAVRVRVVDPGDGPRGDPPGIRRRVVGGECGPAFAQARDVAAAATAPRLSAGSAGGGTVEDGGIPRYPGAGRGGGGHGLVR